MAVGPARGPRCPRVRQATAIYREPDLQSGGARKTRPGTSRVGLCCRKGITGAGSGSNFGSDPLQHGLEFQLLFHWPMFRLKL